MSSLSPYLNSKKIRGELADEADKKIPLIPSSPLKDIMAIDCDSARTWLIVFAVYSGLLTGALIGFLIIRFLKRKVNRSTVGGFFHGIPMFVSEVHSKS